MSGSSSPEVLKARAKELIDKDEVVYDHTNGNTHYFKGKGHKQHDLMIYEITGEILVINEIKWSCSCVYNEYHDDCKHTIACVMLMKQWVGTNKELRDEYKALSSDVDKDKHYHDDDEVMGKVKYKMESDDD